MEEQHTTVNINNTVPTFKAEAFHNNQIKTISLEDYKGKWVIVFFYPADFTFVCPTELSELADHYEEFQKEGAEILSVSTDTVFVHKAWFDNSQTIAKVKFPMLADPTGKISKLFTTYIPEEGLSLRGTFIIDPQGKLKTIEIHDNSIGRSAKELLRKLRAAKFVAENGGEVCPANWQPGEKTLKPGLDLIGKI
jgi:NADH-dependent peroxiredoxin subunit C